MDTVGFLGRSTGEKMFLKARDGKVWTPVNILDTDSDQVFEKSV